MVNNDYLYTYTYLKWQDFTPSQGSTYYYGYSPEDRSHWIDSLKDKYGDTTKFIGLEESTKDVIKNISTKEEFQLRSKAEMSQLLNNHKAEIVYIDITGLNSRICASILKNIVEHADFNDVRVIYAEPELYKVKKFSSEGVFHDLSEKISGIDPLPGFASIFPDNDREVYFVPLLGFEGGRFTHMREHIQPPGDNIFPIIGVPGFRAEYPFVAYWGNRQPLKESDSWRKINFIPANSIVESFLLLKKIHKNNPNCKLKIAPIGTKPHAIGAMLYAIHNPNETELIYDNPKRKKQRTAGVGKVIECSVNKLLQDNS
ncbi:MAG: hypothetical protein KAS17_02330 [Victivallaceae bacterium]|nr:hypothetical protein [Victivallaceae bacterium]